MGTSAGILFLDVKGYSKLKYHELREFHTKICTALSKIIMTGEEKEPYLYKKTWGDGVVLVHKDMYKLAIVALELRDYFNKQKYESDSNGILNKKKLRCRIAIHFGEFETVEDPIDGGKSCYGKGIILPARLEPITEAEHVWATKGATQYLYDKQHADGFEQLSWSYVGHVPLPKGFDTTHVWEMLWVGEKDINGKNGTQDDPVVPPNTKTKAAHSSAEPYVPLSKIEADRIKALTGKNPKTKKANISVCSRDRAIKKCPAKARTVLAMSEMERNGQAAAEETQIACWIHEICTSTQSIVESLDSGGKSLERGHMWVLKENIRQMFECFNTFSRDTTWPDYYNWPASFLEWRLKGLDPKDAKELSGMLINFGLKFQEFFENSIKSEETKSNPVDITPEMDECLRYLLFAAQSLNTHLGKGAMLRLGVIKEIMRDAFYSFHHLKFAQHIEDLTKNLGSYTKVAGVWS